MTSTLASRLIADNGYQKSKIIQLLNDLQQQLGYLPIDELRHVSHELNISLSKLWGIISFYSHYKLEKPAKFTVRICSGTACHVKNSKILKENFDDHMADSPSGLYTTESVACLGCCALAPVFEINGEVHGKINTTKVRRLAESIKNRRNEDE